MSERDEDWAREERLKIDGLAVRLFVAPPVTRRAGGAPALPIVFVHGLGCSGETWKPTIREMNRRGIAYTAIAPDMPGYGHSEGPSEALGMEDLADWLVRLLDVRGIRRVHLVGNSMGCQVSLALARRHPERVGGMVLQGATTGDRIEPAWRYVTGLLADTIYERPSYTLRLLKMYAQMGPVRYAQTVAKMLEDDPFASIKAVQQPCLVIRGGNDAIISDGIARRLVAALPDAVYLPLDSAAHAIEYNNPKEFTDAVLTFLCRVEERLGVHGVLEAVGVPG